MIPSWPSRASGAAVGCPREAEVFEAVAFNRVADVRDHLAACAVCAEIADVAGVLRAEHAAACREAPVPSAGAVWWRATIRARAEAARTVSQPITILQGVAGACGVGLACALAGVAWRSLPWVDSVGDVVARLDERRDEIAAAFALVVQYGLPITLALAACLVVAPLALYLALADD
jgi:hypothetical protein